MRDFEPPIDPYLLALFKALVKYELCGTLSVGAPVTVDDFDKKIKDINQYLQAHNLRPFGSADNAKDRLRGTKPKKDNDYKGGNNPTDKTLDKLCKALLKDKYDYLGWADFVGKETPDTPILSTHRDFKTRVNNHCMAIINEDGNKKLNPSTNNPLPESKLRRDKIEPPLLSDAINNSNFNNVFHNTSKNDLSAIKNELVKKRILCLAGLPGVGKTFIAKKIAFDNLDKNYEIVWWIDADGSKIESSLVELAVKLYRRTYSFGPSALKSIFEGEDSSDEDKRRVRSINESNLIENTKKESGKRIINALIQDLQNHSWLLVYDNICDYDNNIELLEFKKSFLPNTKLSDLLILTSQNKLWNSKELYYKELNIWSASDVKEYLRENSIKIKEEEEILLDKVFGGLPLAVEIARHYILNQQGTHSFSNFYKDWLNLDKKKSLLEHSLQSYRGGSSLFLTIQLAYINLKQLKLVATLLACFAPDELPIRIISKENEGLKFNKFIIDTEETFLDAAEQLSTTSSLVRIKEEHSLQGGSVQELSSMHRLVQECLQLIQKDEDKEQLIKNYKIVISLLSRAFAKSKELLSSHSDLALNIVLNESKLLNCKLIDTMNIDEKDDAIKLFLESAKYHFDSGDTKIAEARYRDALRVVDETSDKSKLNGFNIAEVKKGLANTLFLKGKAYFPKASELAEEAAQHYKKENDIINSVACSSDVVSKIYQRECRFEDCKELLENVRDQVEDHNKSIKGNIPKHIVQQYIDNKKELAEKLSGIYHNLGSLYWTWGGKGHYEEAEKYFNQSIDFQENLIEALEKRISRIGEEAVNDAVQKKLEDIKNIKILYLNVSRMLYGAVLGLQGRFIEQRKQHMLAFDDFKGRANEKRRYAYTAYYKLAYGWDDQKLKRPPLPEDFNSEELQNEIELYRDILENNDEKYDVIRLIVSLRSLLRESVVDKDDLEEAHKELWKKLEAMKYGKRYYDVDTFSVSAFLDYGQYLYNQYENNKDEDIKNEAISVTKHALDITDGIEYHRRKELEDLVRNLGLI